MQRKFKIIALANQKGGVAKTTCTYNLATVKAMQSNRVLMIDLDPQASLTIACGIEPGAEILQGFSTCNLFDAKTDPAECCFSVDKTKLENLYLVPSDINLALTERNLVISRNSDIQLKKAVQKLKNYFDYVFIDCPPQLGMLLTNALVAADEVIIPVKTEYLAYRGLHTLVDTIEGIKSGDGDFSLNPLLQFTGIIATMFQTSSNDHRDVLALLRKKFPLLGVVKNTVEVNRKIVEGMPVVLANPNAAVSLAFREIADKI